MDIGHKGPNKSPLIKSPFFNNEYNGFPLPPPFPAFLLQEDLFLILQEDGFPILLE
jgi:hypothetical protein